MGSSRLSVYLFLDRFAFWVLILACLRFGIWASSLLYCIIFINSRKSVFFFGEGGGFCLLCMESSSLCIRRMRDY